jgi:hypothetical protein
VKTKDATLILSLTRRRFVQGLAAGGALAELNSGCSKPANYWKTSSDGR